MKHSLTLLTALLLAPLAALPAAEVPQTSPTHRVLFRQPELAGFVNRMYVQARVPSGDFAMVGWQKSPFTPDGKFLPVGWDAGSKTGLAVTGDRTLAQRGMRDVDGELVRWQGPKRRIQRKGTCKPCSTSRATGQKWHLL